MFEQSKYRPETYKNLLDRLNLGYFWQRAYSEKTYEINSKGDLDNTIYDEWEYLFNQNHRNFICGISGKWNKLRNNDHFYCDGLCFYLGKQEFIDCLSNFNDDSCVSRLCSFIFNFNAPKIIYK